jgi:hypothetical protein
MSIIYTRCNYNATWQDVKNGLKSGLASKDLNVFFILWSASIKVEYGEKY